MGIFSQALAVYTIFSLFAVLGLNSSVIKHVAEYKENFIHVQEIFSSASVIALFFSILITGLVVLLTYIFPSIFFNLEVTEATRFICLGLPFFTQNKIFMALTNGLRHMKTYSIIQSCRWIFIIVIIALLILLKQNFNYILLSFLFTEIILFFFFLIFYFKYFTLNLKNTIWFKRNMIFGSKSVFLGVLSETNNKIDIFFISFFLTNYDVGIYSFASTIVKGFLSISSVVQLNVNPIVSDLWTKKDIIALKQYTSRISKIMLLVISPLLILAAIAYPIFINLFMKDSSYLDSLPIFYILLAGVFLPAVYYFAGSYLSMSNHLNVALKNMLTIIVFNAISCAIFISIFGFYGAAISTACTYIFSVSLMHFLIKKKMNFNLIEFKIIQKRLNN